MGRRWVSFRRWRFLPFTQLCEAYRRMPADKVALRRAPSALKWSPRIARMLNAVTALHVREARCTRRSHEPLGERAALSLLAKAPDPHVMVRRIQRRLLVVGVIRGQPCCDRLVALDEQGAVRAAECPSTVAVPEPGRNDLSSAAHHILALVPGMPAILGVGREQGADLVGVIGDPGVCVCIEPRLHLLRVNAHGPRSSDSWTD